MPATRNCVTKRMQTSLRLDQRRLCCRKHNPGSAKRHSHRARTHNANTDRLRRLISTSRNHGSSTTQTSLLCCLGAYVTRDLVAFKRWRQPVSVDMQRIQYFRRPATLAQIEEHRARAIRFVHRERAGEFVANIVFGKQDVTDAAIDIRFVRLQPKNLRRRETG